VTVPSDPVLVGIYCDTVLTPGIFVLKPLALFKAELTVLFNEPKALLRAPPALVGFYTILYGSVTIS
jgi:hypothetical protein